MDDKPFVTLTELADRTGLPVRWLRDEYEAGRLPHLIVRKKPMFNPAAVVAALAERTAQQEVSHGTH